MTSRVLLITIVLAVLTAGTALADPESRAVRPLAEVASYALAPLELRAIESEDRWRDAEGLPWRYAMPEDVRLSPANAGTWETLPDGRLLWRLRFESPGALSLNLGVTRFFLPGDAVLQVYAPSAVADAQIYDATDNRDHGQLWTPVVLGDEVVVEIEVDAARRGDLRFDLDVVNRGYRLFGEDRTEKSGACNIDVVCPDGDEWRDEIDTVGMISVSGREKCSGFMVNNTALDGRPLFVTANHCSLTTNTDASLVVYWNYQKSVCDGPDPGPKLDSQSGSTWLAATALSDFTIVELDEKPNPAWGVKYAGWNRSTDDPTSAVGIHHPSTDEKSISFENDPLITSTYFGNIAPGDGTHLRVQNWNKGTTEGGSSGSPLFDQDGYVVGELHGGQAACGFPLPDWYGRLSYAWDEGTTPEARLMEWLDPLDTGAVTLDLFDPLASRFIVTPTTGFEAGGVRGQIIWPDSVVYTLTNDGEEPVPFSVELSVPWLEVDAADGVIPSPGAVDVTVSLTDAVQEFSVGTYDGQITFHNPAAGNAPVPRTVTVAVTNWNSRITNAIPNPFETYTEIVFEQNVSGSVRARVLDIRGRLIADLGSRSFPAGESRWAWGGDDGAGWRVPSGVYIFELQVAGYTHRRAITLTH